MNLNATLDAASLAAIGRIADFDVAFATEMSGAILIGLERLQEEAYTYMWATFNNPSGNVEDSLGYGMDTPLSGWMGTDSPYGARLNWGFSGKTDALGRYYAEWPSGQYSGGYLWAEHSIEVVEPELTRLGIKATVDAVGGTP